MEKGGGGGGERGGEFGENKGTKRKFLIGFKPAEYVAGIRVSSRGNFCAVITMNSDGW